MEEVAPGFRFYPTEEEKSYKSFYLRKHLQGGSSPEPHRVIPVIHIFELEPWHLPKLSGHGDTEQWFFFTPRQEREARGGRPKRTTTSGFWKATGSPGYVYSSDNRVIGVKKNMVFYEGKAPTGRKTIWKMNEYKAIEEVAATNSSSSPTSKLRHEFSLCRLYVTSGSLRAFDRRPPRGAETRMTMTQQVHGDRAATTSQNTQVVEKTSSLESSDSGGTTKESTNLQMAYNEGLQPLWDWEKLHWV